MPRKKKKLAHGGKRKGAGRPAAGGRTTTSRGFTANAEEDTAILRRTRKDKISIGQVIRAAVRSYLGLDAK